MDAGRKLFAEQGYEATSLQQIVKEASTSIGNCYFYFPNKEALLLAVAEEFRQEIAATIDRAIETQTPGPGLLAVAVYAGTLAVLQQPEMARFTLSDTAHPALRPITMALFASRVERAFQAMPHLLSNLPEATPQLAALAWHGAANYVIEEALRTRISTDPERIAHFLVRWNLQALGMPEPALHEALNALDTYIQANRIAVPDSTIFRAS